jgi:hypothetical protein
MIAQFNDLGFVGLQIETPSQNALAKIAAHDLLDKLQINVYVIIDVDLIFLVRRRLVLPGAGLYWFCRL